MKKYANIQNGGSHMMKYANIQNGGSHMMEMDYGLWTMRNWKIVGLV